MAQAAGYRSPRFLTFKQALELGGNVRKGEHGTRVTVITAHPAKARRCPGRAVRAEIPVRGH